MRTVIELAMLFSLGACASPLPKKQVAHVQAKPTPSPVQATQYTVPGKPKAVIYYNEIYNTYNYCKPGGK